MRRLWQLVDAASDPWGVKVLRYEIKDINPPPSVRDALEKQMRAEREEGLSLLNLGETGKPKSTFLKEKNKN